MKQIRFNRSPRNDEIKYIVIHDTGNTGKGANADAHFTYFDTGNRGSSADFFVDDTKALQVNDYNQYYTWHCGDGHGKYGITNANSIGIEMCINSDGNYNKAFENTIAITKELMAKHNIPPERVVRHYDASRKNCPNSMSANGWARWYEFKRRLTETEELTMTQYEELDKKIEELNGTIDDLCESIQRLTPMVYNYMDDNMPDWAKPTVQKLMDRDILNGNEKGELGLTYEMLRTLVMLDRAGVFDK
ncbi:MAG: N-acetylmuramoyl-L-alanine amidase [Clostridia bacterium]|nr:N-acetylmuramoyl-L-alanine amidase [Clostridia bacterium]MBQ3462086.1 N-acetylmuramoyl-L-alanine amidase [Clostridia bacterium]MBQ3471481.1 N-acetylmuramoyl-L-alanine amidase [Clostridia bacterium]MBQ9599412.1 N-acetylmuramoyl-L-alanine amidase [Clostridia bacterium]MBR0471000.1 N-acetylmuramoyl-L-alanine amidase [Clostridia bacterium]